MDLPSIHVKIDSPVLEVRRGPAAGRATSHVWSRFNPGSLASRCAFSGCGATAFWPNGADGEVRTADPRRAPLSRRQHGGMQSLKIRPIPPMSASRA